MQCHSAHSDWLNPCGENARKQSLEEMVERRPREFCVLSIKKKILPQYLLLTSTHCSIYGRYRTCSWSSRQRVERSQWMYLLRLVQIFLVLLFSHCCYGQFQSRQKLTGNKKQHNICTDKYSIQCSERQPSKPASQLVNITQQTQKEQQEHQESNNNNNNISECASSIVECHNLQVARSCYCCGFLNDFVLKLLASAAELTANQQSNQVH